MDAIEHLNSIKARIDAHLAQMRENGEALQKARDEFDELYRAAKTAEPGFFGRGKHAKRLAELEGEIERRSVLGHRLNAEYSRLALEWGGARQAAGLKNYFDLALGRMPFEVER